MKIFGKPIKGPQEEILVIPRSRIVDGKTEAQDIVFIARAVLDYTELDAILPPPKPPFMIKAGSVKSEENLSDPDFMKKMTEWQNKRFQWLMLKSLEATPGLEWEKIDMKKPETWHLLPTELHEAGFNQVESATIQNLASRVNSLDEDKVEEARKRFLASREETPDK